MKTLQSRFALVILLIPTSPISRRYTQVLEARHFGKDAEIQAMDGN